MKWPPESTSPRSGLAQTVSAGCTPIAASGCSSAPLPTGKLRRWWRAETCTWEFEMPFGKGSRHAPEGCEYTDQATGAKIRQLTGHPSINHPTYFLQSSFTPDGSALIFTSYRSGSAQLFEASFPHGEIRQLTDASAIHPFSPAIHPGGERIFFVRGGAVWQVDRASLSERRIVEFPGAQLGECSLGPGGEWVTAAIKHGANCGIVVGRSDGSQWR